MNAANAEIRVVNLTEKFAKFQDYYSPKVVGQINDFQVKLVKLQGEFVWHHHVAEDELFMVAQGELHMKLRHADGRETDEAIRPGEFIFVPHGVEHMPYALVETHILLLEPGTTLNTGNVQNERTVAKLESL